MRRLLQVILVFLLLGAPTFGQRVSHSPSSGHARGSVARPRYSGSHHTTSHGGRYAGERNAHHQGGHYVNPRTNNRYGVHKQ
jgi:hypothetical protein